ncbi:MAG: FtsQ-type POTRA domain-containing protein [Alphaproteobacteria bacterium]
MKTPFPFSHPFSLPLSLSFLRGNLARAAVCLPLLILLLIAAPLAPTHASTIWPQLQDTLNLRVSEVWISGHQQLTRKEIHNALGVSRGDRILNHKLNDLTARLESLPWVDHAHIQRRLPGELFIQIQEKQACARHQNNKNIQLIDTQGQIIHNAHAKNFPNLPLLVGTNAQNACQLWTQWNQILPNQQLLAAVKVSQRRWNLILNHNITIMLPEQNHIQALQKLQSLQTKHNLLSILHNHQTNQTNKLTLDLRVKNRIRLRGYITEKSPENSSANSSENSSVNLNLKPKNNSQKEKIKNLLQGKP